VAKILRKIRMIQITIDQSIHITENCGKKYYKTEIFTFISLQLHNIINYIYIQYSNQVRRITVADLKNTIFHTLILVLIFCHFAKIFKNTVGFSNKIFLFYG